MNIDQLKTFHQVARTGSFTRAADELHLTQPAVSQQIKSLEASFGITLFDRSNKKVRLSNEGEILLAYTSRLFDLFEEIETLFDQFEGLSRGKIRLGSTAVLGTYFLPRVIGRYSKQYPGIDIDLRMGNSQMVHNWVLEGNVDIGFAGMMKIQPRVIRIRIHRELLLMVCSKDNLLAQKKSVRIADLESTPFIWREKGTQTRSLVKAWFEKNIHKKFPNKSIELQNLEAAKRTVIEGYGITVTPEIAVRREIHLGLLKKLHLKDFSLWFDYYVLLLKGKIFSKASQAFMAMLADFKLLSEADNLKEHLNERGLK
jgi:DNA-binding transcriptional LysR family regulator